MVKKFILGLVLLGLFTVFGCKDMDNGNGPPPPPPQRVMSILWCGDENWAETMRGVSVSVMKTLCRDLAERWDVGYGGTHIVGFHEPCRPDWYVGYEVKLISYLKYYSLDEIREYARRWKDHPNNGGYWMIEGHEPDITGGSMHEPGTVEAHKQLRIAQYKAIREEDPDAWNHPVVIFYNMTGASSRYPGWQNAFPMPEEGVDCDIFVIDCYPVRCDGTVDYPGMEDGARLVEIGKARSQAQFIPNLDACYKQDCRSGPVVDQWEWWKERMGELKGVCFWNSGMGTWAVGVYEDEYLAEQVKEVNRRLGLLK